jgi:hypothetical protein
MWLLSVAFANASCWDRVCTRYAPTGRCAVPKAGRPWATGLLVGRRVLCSSGLAFAAGLLARSRSILEGRHSFGGRIFEVQRLVGIDHAEYSVGRDRGLAEPLEDQFQFAGIGRDITDCKDTGQ